MLCPARKLAFSIAQTALESLFSRLRGVEAGHHHRIVNAYLGRYAQEGVFFEGIVAMTMAGIERDAVGVGSMASRLN